MPLAFAMVGSLSYYHLIVSVEHALSCPFGGFPSIQHNELHDITAALLSEVSHNVSAEPNLQPLSGEQFHYRSANVEDGACLDVSAESFWGRDRRLAYFDIKVFNPFASTYASSPFPPLVEWVLQPLLFLSI